MNSREGVGISRRYQVRLPVALASSLEEFAQQRSLGLAPTIRMLLSRALESESSNPAATLACQIAAEHALLLVASILPEGERRMRSLSSRAAETAAERLTQIRKLMMPGQELA